MSEAIWRLATKIVSKAKDMIHIFSGKNAYLKRFFLREPKGHQGFLTAVLGLRFVALLGMILRFGLNRATYADSPQTLNLVRVSLIVIFLYLRCVKLKGVAFWSTIWEA